jgi:hypothetical protein
VIDEHPLEEPPEAPGTLVGPLRLEADIRDGDRADLSIIAAPSLDDIAEALGTLDQRTRTEMTLIDGSGAYVTVGGGRGRYHVFISAFDHDDRIVLQAHDAGERDEVLIVDGRPQPYAAREVVGLDAAAEAVLEFARSGRPHPDQTWRSG